MSNYVGINNISRPITAGYVGVNDVARKIIAGYVGVNGVAKSIWADEMPDPIDLIEGNFTTYENELVTSIGNYAFSDCTALTDVSFPNVTSIGASAFYGCTALTDISFPNVTSIGNYAFQQEFDDTAQKTKLASVRLPKVDSIGDHAFYFGFYGFEPLDEASVDFYLGGDSVCVIYAETFVPDENLGTTHFYVKASLVDAYKADSAWSQYEDRIVGV